MYLLFLLCLTHAVRQGKRHVCYLVGGLLFGLLLEYIEVLTGNYTYGRFMVMFGREPLYIPLCIGAGWGIIMYTARLFTDRLGLPLLACAALDTLLALNIDLSMDTVAYRLHMWHWNWSGTGLNPLTAQWFGIPYGNFVGWQTVVFCYSLFSRWWENALLRRSSTIIKCMLVAFLALLCSQIVLYTEERYIFPVLGRRLGIGALHRFVGITLGLLILVVWGWRKRTSVAMVPAVTWWVPGWFHLFFFICFFVLGFYTENNWMTAAACTNLLAGVALHRIN